MARRGVETTVVPHLERFVKALVCLDIVSLNGRGKRDVEATVIPYIEKLKEALPIKLLIETIEVQDGRRTVRGPPDKSSMGSHR